MTTPPRSITVSVFDYQAGNLHSLLKSIDLPHVTVRVDTDPAEWVRNTDAVILPGVGAFAPAAAYLAPARDTIRDALFCGLPALGICLGMQLLFDESDEGPGLGLGIVAGRVERLRAQRIPQIGWNTLELTHPTDALFDAAPLETAYYANSFVCRPALEAESAVIAWSTHETDRFVAAVRRGNTVGVQFHPEKSSTAGVRFVQAFLASVHARGNETSPGAASLSSEASSHAASNTPNIPPRQQEQSQ